LTHCVLNIGAAVNHWISSAHRIPASSGKFRVMHIICSIIILSSVIRLIR